MNTGAGRRTHATCAQFVSGPNTLRAIVVWHGELTASPHSCSPRLLVTNAECSQRDKKVISGMPKPCGIHTWNSQHHLQRQDRSLETMFVTLRRLVACCTRAPPCASKLLLEDAHPAVQAALNKRLAHGSRGQQAGAAEWPECHRREYQQAGLRWGCPPPDQATSTSPWYGTLTARERSTLVYCLARYPDQLMYNLSQQLTRVPTSSKSANGCYLAPTQLPGQLLWLSLAGGVPRLQLGREALLFLGFPLLHMQPLLDRTGEALLQDLAGNAMALPVLLAILMSTFASVSWRTGASAADAPASSAEEVAAALAMFDRLARTGPEKIRIHPCSARGSPSR